MQPRVSVCIVRAALNTSLQINAPGINLFRTHTRALCVCELFAKYCPGERGSFSFRSTKTYLVEI